MSARWCTIQFAVLAAACSTLDLEAQDFRIETKVFPSDEEDAEPAATNLTLFRHGVVYDFLGEPTAEITVYDPRQRWFTLLDGRRQMKTRIDQEILLQFVAGIQARALHCDDAILREAAKPQFKLLETDETPQQFDLRGKFIHYQVRGENSFPTADAAQRYFDFADMYTRLNATRPGALPPMARLELNKQLAQHRWMPTRVERTIEPAQPGRRLFGRVIRIHSEHEIAWQLLEGDQQRMDTASRWMANFRPVTFAEYRQLGDDEEKEPDQ